jgi:hypothetical protein
MISGEMQATMSEDSEDHVTLGESVRRCEQFLKLAQNYRVSKMKVDNLEFEFLPELPPAYSSADQALQDTAKALQKDDMPRDDQMLFMSTDTFMADTSERTDAQRQIDKEIAEIMKEGIA